MLNILKMFYIDILQKFPLSDKGKLWLGKIKWKEIPSFIHSFFTPFQTEKIEG